MGNDLILSRKPVYIRLNFNLTTIDLSVFKQKYRLRRSHDAFLSLAIDKTSGKVYTIVLLFIIIKILTEILYLWILKRNSQKA